MCHFFLAGLYITVDRERQTRQLLDFHRSETRNILANLNNILKDGSNDDNNDGALGKCCQGT